MRKHARLILVSLLGFLAFATTAALADSHVRIVRLSYLNGQVKVDKGEGAGYEQALPNMPVVEGLKIATGSDGVTELEFEDGTTFRVTPESEIEVRQLALEDSGATLSTVALLHGTAYIDFRKRKDDVFNLVLPNQNISLSHAVRMRAEVAEDEAELAVFSGELDLDGSDHVLRVKKDESVTLDISKAGEYTLAKEIDPAPYDDWSKEREKYRERYASSIDNSRDTPAYGVADLAYYGSSFDLPGYGWVWQPYGIGYNWNPFYSGYWNYYPTTGWMWCSYAPWGWYPYRYGSWMFAPGYGWVWSPGTIITGWRPIPPVFGAPAGFQPPVRPIRKPMPRETVVAVGAAPVIGPGHRLYDPSDPVLAVRGGLQRPGTAAPASASANNRPTPAGGVSTFAPATPASGDRPASISDLRRSINTPQNESALGVMKSEDTYNRQLHKEMEQHAPAYAAPAATAHGTTPHPSAGAPPSWSHAGAPSSAPSHSAPAPMHAGGGGGFSGGGMSHSSPAPSGGGGGGGGHAGAGGRPPR